MEVILNGRSPSQVVDIPEPLLTRNGSIKHATKRVRFNLKGDVGFKCFPDGSIQADETSQSFAKNVLTEFDIESLWYSTRECRGMELDAREMVTFLLATSGRYQTALETILKASNSGVNGSNWAWLLELAHMDVNPTAGKRKMRPKRTELSYSEALSLVADASARGLEKMVIKQLKTESGRLYRECTEGDAANALKSYKQWRDCDDLTDSQKETLLTQRQRESSEIAAWFARCHGRSGYNGCS